MKKKILLIDNFDSFTFNLAEEFESRNCDVQVWRNNLPVESVFEMIDHQTLVVISPGPGTPREAGCCIELIQQMKGRVPIFGVCLGHQAIVEAFGGVVGAAESIMHGKTSVITHDGAGLFANLPTRLQVARYHSLCATSIPDSLRVTANFNNLVMALEHKTLPIWGVQFHPESILTTEGGLMIDNVLSWSSL